MSSIRRRGNKWNAQVRLKTNGVIVSQVSATFDTEAQARVWAHAAERKARNQGAFAKDAKLATVSKLLSVYSGYTDKLGKFSRGVQHSVTLLARAPFADKHIEAVSAREIVEWGAGLSRTLAPATILHAVMTLRSAVQTAPLLLEVSLDTSAVFTAITLLRKMQVTAKSKSRTRRVTDAEIEAIVGYLQTKNLLVPTDTFIKLAVAFPRRREELLTMRWGDYDGTTILLRDTKNPRAPRDETVPVPRSARTIIEGLGRIDERILPYKPESVSAAFQRAVRALGIQDVRLHDLRHEGISRLFEQGLQIHEVAVISGHQSWAALKRYTHIKPETILGKLDHHARIQTAQKATAQPQES